MSADAVGTEVSIFVCVNSPVTREGRTFRVTPLPFDVEIFELKSLTPVPPLNVRRAPIAQEAAVAVALKLPLDCARARPEPKTAASVAAEKTNAKCLLTPISHHPF